MRQTLRFFSRFVAGTLLLLGLTAGGVWWWSGSQGSLATALRWVSQSTVLLAPSSLSAEDVTGSIRHGGRVGRLSWQNKGLRVTASQIEARWQVLELISGRLQIEQLHLASLQIDPLDTPEKPAATLPLSIFFQLSSPIEEVQNRAYAAAVVLTIIVLIISITAKIISKNLSKNKI